MGYRSFTDSQGSEWQAWDIVPRLAERRAHERRVARRVVDRERRGAERRLHLTDRAVLGHGMHLGWLCFEAATEKRRLAPIPADWLGCPVARLEEYLRTAIPATRVDPGLRRSALDEKDRRAG